MYVGKLKRALICTRSYWPMMCFQAPDMVRANDELARAKTRRSARARVHARLSMHIIGSRFVFCIVM